MPRIIKYLHPALHGYEARFTKDLLPRLDLIETRRKALVRHQQKVMGLTSLISIVLLAVVFLLNSRSSLWLVILPISAPLVFFWGSSYSFKKVKLFQEDTKQIIMDTIVAHFDWTFKGGLISVSGLSEYVNNGLLPKHNKSSSEDYIEGRYNGVDFTFYELDLRNYNGKDTNTVFKGLVLTFEPPRKFSGRTVVLRGRKFSQFNKLHGMKRVGLVDPVFEKIFEAYSTDQVEGRYLLTPDFMQHLVDLETAMRGKKIRFGFLEGKLCVALEAHNHFETGSIKEKLTDPAPVRKILNEVSALLYLMDAILEKQKPTKLS